MEEIDWRFPRSRLLGRNNFRVPVKETGISLADPDHPVASETRFEQWHDVDGRKVAGRIIKFHAGKKVAEITLEKTIQNTGMKPADLAIKPPDLNPVIPQ